MTTATGTDVTRPSVAPRPATKPGYRPELQGLRAAAVLLIVVYHVWLGRVSGGVDVFLMLSAYLMTLAYLGRVESGKPLHPLRRTVHRFQQLLPLAAFTIIATMVGVRLLLNQHAWEPLVTKANATITYTLNWLLIAQQADYYTDAADTSPLRHFWSLSVQGQVFLIWPLLFVLIAAVVRRTRANARTVAAVVFSTVFLASFCYSVWYTRANQVAAYFDTGARLWEFALGSLMALLPVGLKLGDRARWALAWLGVLGIVSCGLILDVEGSFPGYAALWPVLSAGAVILAGRTGSPTGADRLLSSAPLVKLGDISYALYLLHWPILVVGLQSTYRDRAGLGFGLVVIALSLVAAWLATRLFDTPVKAWAGKGRALPRQLLVGVISVAMVMTATHIAEREVQRFSVMAYSQPHEMNPGALTLFDPSVPTPSTARKVPVIGQTGDYVALPTPCTGPAADSANQDVRRACTQNREDSRMTIVVVGNSHSGQFMGALVPIANAREWRVISYVRPVCSFGQRPDECGAYNAAVMERIRALHPDAVLTVVTAASADNADGETPVEGQLPYLQQISQSGIAVLGFRDAPRFSVSPYQCSLKRRPADEDTCRRPLSEHLHPNAPIDAFAELPGFTFLDFGDIICPQGSCAPAVGNVYTYFDQHHITALYAYSMAPYLDGILTHLPWVLRVEEGGGRERP